jgi:hypothetical protein
MGYIFHNRKIVVVEERTSNDYRHLYNDRQSRVVLIKVPGELRDVEDAIRAILDSTKDTNAALDRVRRITAIEGIEVHIVAPRSSTVTQGKSGDQTHWRRTWVNRVFHLVNGELEYLEDSDLNFIGWEDAGCAAFLTEKFAYNTQQGEHANFDNIDRMLQGFKDLDIIRNFKISELSLPDAIQFTLQKDEPEPFDYVAR